jgi:hypothetical protein
LNAIEILTAKETSIFNMLGKTAAHDTVHSYLVDTLKTAASNALEESSDYTYLQRTTPTRQTNIVQILSIPVRVSNTQREVEHYHGQDELARQMGKGLMEWANDAEFVLLNETLTSGTSGTTAPKMSGILEAISQSTNYTAHNSGTVWAATILDALMANNFDASNGDVASDLFMGSYLRGITDGFVQKSNIVVNGGGMTSIVKTVSSYQTAFGTLQIHTHRYIQQGATGQILGLNPEKLKVAFLKKPYVQTDVAKAGDYEPRVIIGKMTLEVRNKTSNFYVTGFKKS